MTSWTVATRFHRSRAVNLRNVPSPVLQGLPDARQTGNARKVTP